MKSSIIWLDSIDSTNSEAKRCVSDVGSWTVISAKQQTHGRGQNGNKWFSEKSKNLTFSLILKDLSIRSWNQSAISEAISVAIVDALESYEITARIKWPNDIYCGKNKIGGILIEHSIMGDKIRWSIVGIGLNVNQRIFPLEIPNPTSMFLCCSDQDIEYPLDQVMERILFKFEEYHNTYLQNEDNLTGLRQIYQDLLISVKDLHL